MQQITSNRSGLIALDLMQSCATTAEPRRARWARRGTLAVIVTLAFAWPLQGSAASMDEEGYKKGESKQMAMREGESKKMTMHKGESKKMAMRKAKKQVNINEASAKEIAKALKGVGKKKAQDIVDHRQRYGPFQSENALTRVRGIGKKTLAKNEGVIILE